MARRKHLSLTAFAAAAVIAATGFAFAQNQQQPQSPPPGSSPAMMQIKPPQGFDATVSNQDKQFLKAAAQINLMEIKLGQMAGNQAKSQAVKDLGQRLIYDHKQLQDQLKQLGKRVHVKIAKSLDDQHQAKVKPLNDVHGAQFDRDYTNMMVQGHQKAIMLFGKETRQGSNLAVMNWATEGQQILRIHESLAHQAQQKASAQPIQQGG